MAVRRTITVSVPPEQHDFPGERVPSSRDSRVGEVVRAALRRREQTEPYCVLKQQARIDTAAHEGR